MDANARSAAAAPSAHTTANEANASSAEWLLLRLGHLRARPPKELMQDLRWLGSLPSYAHYVPLQGLCNRDRKRTLTPRAAVQGVGCWQSLAAKYPDRGHAGDTCCSRKQPVWSMGHGHAVYRRIEHSVLCRFRFAINHRPTAQQLSLCIFTRSRFPAIQGQPRWCEWAPALQAASDASGRHWTVCHDLRAVARHRTTCSYHARRRHQRSWRAGGMLN